MGACTSTEERRQKNRQLHKRTDLQKSIVIDNKQLSPIPLTVLRNQRPHSLSTDLDLQSSSIEEPLLDQTTTNSLIQLYSLKSENNHPMSSSHIPPRMPVSKSRVPTHPIRPQRPRHPPPTTLGITSPTGIHSQTMSGNNRPTLPPASSHPTQTRFGFIPRPTTPAIQQAQGTSLVERSRSISPSSTNSVNASSSTTTASQRLAKPQSTTRPAFNRSVTSNTTTSSKPKLPSSSPQKDPPKSTITQRLRSTISSSETSTAPTKTDVNAIRDRYKTQKRPNFLSRRSPLSSASKPPALETPVIEEEKTEPTTSTSIEDSQNTEMRSESSLPVSTSQVDSAYASAVLPSNQSSSAHYSQAQRIRHRHSSTISSSSLLSDVLNQDVSLDDDNCSLKSEDLICDYDETLTLDSASKNDATDSCSSNSLSIDSNKKPTVPTSVTTKTNIPSYQTVSKDHRSSTSGKTSNIELQQSLDELGRLSNRIDTIVDSEHQRRLLTRSVSLKPPTTSLPPREDGEQILMDIESYRQVMKDVMVVKTILHQLDRLLKHSDGANMTDSMIGSFHESMISSRHFPNGLIDGNTRNSLDENSSNDDLFKEIFTLRKEREQDKQTIKLLQEQMYKYSSQSNDSNHNHSEL